MNRFWIFFFLLFFPQTLWAASHHGDDHSQIFHSFIFEGEVGESRDGGTKHYDLSGWVGGDYNRLWLRGDKKSFNTYNDKTEIQALYSRNVASYWDVQAGIRHDFRSDFASRSVDYLAVGVEGLAPYFFETTAHVFYSEHDDWSARWKQEFDILFTQRLIMQPYFEADIFAQDVPRLEVQSGISEIEVGALTRYEFHRKFAPYFALRYNTKTFATKRYAQRNQEKVDNFIVAIGLRLRF